MSLMLLPMLMSRPRSPASMVMGARLPSLCVAMLMSLMKALPLNPLV
ncbi:hypothetical protein [Pusillimonas noertemannii]|nr:hypothetical protein [Pusillimonas noertemannii]NYT68385.1 hypothetical protein [Pusillimonas noertemannii]